ncbi:hypothetical protein OROGR_001018 [Orobanche gracilis]
MDPEAVLNLFDSSWFYLKILEKSQSEPPTSEPNPSPQIQQKSSKINVPRQLTISTRSKSDQLIVSNSNPDIPSPISQKPYLATIPSEREFSIEIPRTPKLNKPRRGLNKKMKRLSKSLSELEFEEMEGFMDLGFVFSEEDKGDSSLAEIIPGLQKLGRDCEERRIFEESCASRARPYLSEAWNVYHNRQMERAPLMEWRMPAVSNEIDMKDSLKWWAHSVASAVR